MPDLWMSREFANRKVEQRMLSESTCAIQSQAKVILLDPLSQENYRVRLECPELATVILPGQFFMLRSPDRTDPLLGRPFALYDTYLENGKPVGIDVGFHVVGKMTALLEDVQPGQNLEIWGPLGNGFPELGTKHLIQVAGGIGYTPFVAVSREALLHKEYGQTQRSGIRAERASLIYGVRSACFQANMDDLSDLNDLDIQICTEDGTAGHHGLVTDLLEPLLESGSADDQVVLTCGPLRMMQAVSELCSKYDVRCWASLETPMACGFGACFSCVVPIKTGEGSWDYRRSCVEGPVFPANDILWGDIS